MINLFDFLKRKPKKSISNDIPLTSTGYSVPTTKNSRVGTCDYVATGTYDRGHGTKNRYIPDNLIDDIIG